MLVGWVLIPDGASPGVLFQATTDSAVIAWTDLVVNRELSTFQYGHHLLVLGLLVWGSSQFASYAAFGHRRPLNAVAAIGLLLLANMLLTTRDQMPYIVLYSVSALFLLVRFHTFDEQSDWVRRRIGDPSAISGLYLRGGSIFIAMAVVGSLLLTNVAASAPLAGAWTDMGGRLLEWSRALEPFLPSSGSGRSIGPSFGPNARITGSWTTNDSPFLTIDISPDEDEIPFLAAVVYHTFDKTGWRRTAPAPIQRGLEEELLANTADRVSLDGRRPVVLTITLESPRSEVFTPTMPFSVDQAAGVMVIGEGGYFEGLRREASDAPYTVTALVPASEADGGPTAARLRATGTDYPPEILALYGPDTVADDALGEASRALLAEIRTEAGAQATPYDLAATTRDILRDAARFEYDTDVRDHDCSDISIVECFARIKRGYCEYYASTMAVLLREMGVPTRYVQGMLPGDGEPGSGRSVVRNRDSHAWVQVYFPGYGWVDFDPTGGPGPRLAPLPSGRPEASASPGATRSPGFLRPQETLPRDQPPGGGFTGGPRTPGAAGPLIAVAILLGVGIAAVGRGGMAPWTARSRVGGRDVRCGDPAGVTARIRPAAEPDGLRVRGSARRSRAHRQAGARDGGPRQGRGGLRRAGPHGRPDAIAARSAPTPADRPAPAVRPPRASPAQPLIAARPAGPNGHTPGTPGFARAPRCGCAAPGLPGPPRRAAPRGARSGCGRAGRPDRHETRRR